MAKWLFRGSARRYVESLWRACLATIAPSIVMATCIVIHTTPSSVCVLELLKSSQEDFCNWDITCMISFKWSFSCSSSNEILYLCLRLLWLLNVTMESRVTLYLLLTDAMTAGWPYQHQSFESQWCVVCECVYVCVAGFKRHWAIQYGPQGPKLLKDSSSNQWSHRRKASSAQVQNAITILSYFNKLEYSSLSSLH